LNSILNRELDRVLIGRVVMLMCAPPAEFDAGLNALHEELVGCRVSWLTPRPNRPADKPTHIIVALAPPITHLRTRLTLMGGNKGGETLDLFNVCIGTDEVTRGVSWST
jgi:hypothetical protein